MQLSVSSGRDTVQRLGPVERDKQDLGGREGNTGERCSRRRICECRGHDDYRTKETRLTRYQEKKLDHISESPSQAA